MKEQWIVDAENEAKDLARDFCKRIRDKADAIDIDRIWFFEHVIQYMSQREERNK